MGYRESIRASLLAVAQRVLDESIEPELEIARPERELDPMRGECAFDGMRHYTLGDIETWTITLRHTAEQKERDDAAT